MTLVYYGGHAANDIKHARFYLERAVAGWKDPVVHVATEADAAAKPGAEFFVVAGPLDATATAGLRNKLAAGDFAIVLLNDPAMVDTAAALVGESGWSPIHAAQKNPLFGQIDFQHPLFSLFADPHYSDFTHVQFWQAQSVKLPEKTAAVVAAKFDDGSPAVLEAPVGAGPRGHLGGGLGDGGGFVGAVHQICAVVAGAVRARGRRRAAARQSRKSATRRGCWAGEPAKWRALDAPEGTFVGNHPHPTRGLSSATRRRHPLGRPGSARRRRAISTR